MNVGIIFTEGASEVDPCYVNLNGNQMLYSVARTKG